MLQQSESGQSSGNVLQILAGLQKDERIHAWLAEEALYERPTYHKQVYSRNNDSIKVEIGLGAGTIEIVSMTGQPVGYIYVIGDFIAEELEAAIGSIKEALRTQQLNTLDDEPDYDHQGEPEFEHVGYTNDF